MHQKILVRVDRGKKDVEYYRSFLLYKVYLHQNRIISTTANAAKKLHFFQPRTYFYEK